MCFLMNARQFCLMMFSRGECNVKYNQLKSESEVKAANKRIWAPKIFHFSAIFFVFCFIIVIYMQDDSEKSNTKFKAPNAKSAIQKNSSEDLPNHPQSTHSPFPQTPHVDHTSTSPPAPKACGVQVKDGPVIKVGSLNTYVTGSYMDGRFKETRITTIAIVLRAELVKYSCVMCCEGRNVTSPAQYAVHRDHFGFEYGTATITCPIDSSCLTPTHVAITAREISERITSFLPIRNRNRDLPKVFPYEFTICISVMYDYKNVLNLVESMEMFRLLGAQRVVIYKTNCDSDTQKVLDYYVKRGFVEVIPWTIKNHIKVSSGWRKEISSGQLHYYGQIPALNDCIYRYMHQSHYVALHDLDELILPLKVKTWNELLPELERIYGTTVGFEFENNAFPFSAKAHTNYEQEKWKNIQGTNILNYIERVPNDPRAFNNYKVIVSPRLILKTTVHGLLETVSPGPSTVRVSNSIARMYHSKYFTYPQNTNLITDDHLWDYAKDLIPAVSKVLQDCGFIEA